MLGSTPVGCVGAITAGGAASVTGAAGASAAASTFASAAGAAGVSAGASTLLGGAATTGAISGSALVSAGTSAAAGAGSATTATTAGASAIFTGAATGARSATGAGAGTRAGAATGIGVVTRSCDARAAARAGAATGIGVVTRSCEGRAASAGSPSIFSAGGSARGDSTAVHSRPHRDAGLLDLALEIAHAPVEPRHALAQLADLALQLLDARARGRARHQLDDERGQQPSPPSISKRMKIAIVSMSPLAAKRTRTDRAEESSTAADAHGMRAPSALAGGMLRADFLRADVKRRRCEANAATRVSKARRWSDLAFLQRSEEDASSSSAPRRPSR